MDAIGLILGALGLFGTIYFGVRSKRVSDAFGRYVKLENEMGRLQLEAKGATERIRELQAAKADVYRHKYQPKSRAFVPGDRVKLTNVPSERGWISTHARVGMTGIVVDYGAGTYDYAVYWSGADYEGKPMDEIPNRWQAFFVSRDQIERIG